MAIHTHVEWLKEGVTRWNKRRKRVDFSPDLSGVSFFELLPKDFRDAPKTSRTFEKIDLSDANLTGSDLSNLNFQGANFSNARLINTNLYLSNFDKAKFVGSDLSLSTVENASFRNALFQHANIAELDLKNADLMGASFVAVDLPSSNVRRLEARGAIFFSSIATYRKSKTTASTSSSGSMIGFALQESEESMKKPKNRYDVFYGTNRSPIFEREALSGFGSSRADVLSYGLCEVIVPDGHRIGSLGSSRWKRIFNQKDDRLKIDSLIGLDEELFFRSFIQSASAMKKKQRPTVFVHGFNTSFESAVLRAAQIGYDLGIGQGVGLFSWPSQGRTSAYMADEGVVDYSKYFLADFIEKFIQNSPEKSIDLIAHSMGCRCLLGALDVLSNGRKSILRRVNQVILAAADVDTSIMPRLCIAATNYSKRTTSYVSGKDQALKLSGWLHNFPRAGFTPPTFVMSGMDTILVNDDDLGTLSHGYLGSSRSVLKDVFDLLYDNKAPEQRFSLKAVQSGLWRIQN